MIDFDKKKKGLKNRDRFPFEPETRWVEWDTHTGQRVLEAGSEEFAAKGKWDWALRATLGDSVPNRKFISQNRYSPQEPVCGPRDSLTRAKHEIGPLQFCRLQFSLFQEERCYKTVKLLNARPTGLIG